MLNSYKRFGKKAKHCSGTVSEGSPNFSKYGAGEPGSGEFAKWQYEKLMGYALFLLGIRRLTSQEMVLRLRKRLKKYGRAAGNGENIDDVAENANGADAEDSAKKTAVANETAIEKVIERLKELKYINDTEYLSDFVENRLKLKPKGVRGMKFELMKKGIKNEDIDKYFSENEIDETGIALDLAERKMKSLARVPKDKQKSRLIMFLTSRGFKGQTVYDIIDKLFN
ncbi:MAG: regulatory protein RecX, regulatory protein [Candidatus Peregrinibacteria bacterium GW2011_GWC2_39_14]|nr:MAG: Regulatory protein RecX [Candidatus Peregrinibacteria bacterium GW2011_GWA2_38_36]KKR05247.1 MAG: regulatory protein RecX, regulatory protein [Candidatus Peregrinibacteria bacterium GW2011_GWC2_39_14]